ncbi:hypothetical protein B566_EDAN001515 [Ephemera danica]|nr:hypothetical protein B566_EDAN001515 [Ephemera danica]
MLPHAAVAHCLHEHEDYMVLRVSWNSTEGTAPVALHAQHRPFLSISTRTRRTGRRRSRRNVNCTPGVKECCREKLYVSFREIGWSEWFLQPKGYDAYFCRGSCTSAVSITQSSSFYTSVLQRRQVDLAPCCAPTKLAPLQVLYLDSNMAIMQKTLPNMVVEACGCL